MEGKLLFLDWIQNIKWPKSSVEVNLAKEKIKDSPEYDPSIPTKREYETVLHENYERPKYWEYKNLLI